MNLKFCGFWILDPGFCVCGLLLWQVDYGLWTLDTHGKLFISGGLRLQNFADARQTEHSAPIRTSWEPDKLGIIKPFRYVPARLSLTTINTWYVLNTAVVHTHMDPRSILICCCSIVVVIYQVYKYYCCFRCGRAP